MIEHHEQLYLMLQQCWHWVQTNQQGVPCTLLADRQVDYAGGCGGVALCHGQL